MTASKFASLTLENSLMISNFTQLLQAAHDQEQPQRLLMMFAKTELAKGKSKNKNYQTGSISPVMCVDKLPEELTDFAALSTEADKISKEWSFIFITGLNGQNGQPPSSDDCEQYLNKMASDLMTGQDLAGYMILDREENPVMLKQ
jgi:hypothetical protein